MRRRSLYIVQSLLLLVSLGSVTSTHAKDRMWVFVGTYTYGDSEGVYVLQLDMQTGQLEQRSVVASENPSFVAIHPSGDFVYAVNEVSNFNGEKTGAVSAFAFDREAANLKLINQQSSGGPGPCHLVVDKTGSCVVAANYGGGSVASLKIRKGGRLSKPVSFIQHEGSSVNPQRQEGPHGHSINIDRGNRFAVAADLGLDKLLVYRIDAGKASLTANIPNGISVAAGSGPRHFSFHPNGRHAYVINELLLTVTVFDWDSEGGALTETQTLSTLPAGTAPIGSTAEIQTHPSGRFVYGSNRGHDSIVVYSVDQKTGKLKWVENEPTGGKTPRNFGIDPTGRFLLAANQTTNNIVVFRIDSQTGELSATGHEIEIPTPVCVKMMAVDREN
jgi:6-phosphogluconolactonase